MLDYLFRCKKWVFKKIWNLGSGASVWWLHFHSNIKATYWGEFLVSPCLVLNSFCLQPKIQGLAACWSQLREEHRQWAISRVGEKFSIQCVFGFWIFIFHAALLPAPEYGALQSKDTLPVLENKLLAFFSVGRGSLYYLGETIGRVGKKHKVKHSDY